MKEIKKLAFTDFETTGVDPCRHEIVEFGVVVTDASTLEILAEMDTKVRPEHIESADPSSLVFMGYKEEGWKDAISLEDALAKYSRLTAGATFAGWLTPFDWAFLTEAYRKKNMKNPLDYHTIETTGIAYEKLRDKGDAPRLKLSEICKYFGIEKEPKPHRAINGARKALEVYKKLREL